MTREDALRVLGVPSDASTEDIRRAQRKLLLRVHPDRNPAASDNDKLELLKRSQEINAAVDVLLREETWETEEPSDSSEPNDDGLEPDIIFQTLLSARNENWRLVLNCARDLAPFPQFAYESNVYRAEAMLYLSMHQDAVRAAHEALRLRVHEHLPLFILAAGYSELGQERLALSYIEAAIHKATPTPERYLKLRAAIGSSQPAEPDAATRFHRGRVSSHATQPKHTPVSAAPIYSRPQQPNPIYAPVLAYLERPPSVEFGVILSFIAGGLIVIGAALMMFGRAGGGVCLALTCLIVPFLCKEVYSKRLARRHATIARTVVLAILTGIGLSVGFTAIATGHPALGVVLSVVGGVLFLSALFYAIRRRSRDAYDLK
ncbi:MAG: J domain-containing protein [Planctomycetes bacterium]|nr:J domain-containing protein [Planctomycetota bacterium]